jgi:hypothetical protein
MLQTEAYLTIVIYDCKTLIVQATVFKGKQTIKSNNFDDVKKGKIFVNELGDATFVLTTLVLITFVLMTFVLITFVLTTLVLITFVLTTFVLITFVLTTIVLITF